MKKTFNRYFLRKLDIKTTGLLYLLKILEQNYKSVTNLLLTTFIVLRQKCKSEQ